MSTLIYNGITLAGCETLGYERAPVLDGPNYLYTRHRVHVRCLYNPLVNSYNPAASAGVVGLAIPVITAPPAVPGNLPTITDDSIKHNLMQQRRQLIYAEGGSSPINLVSSPPLLPAGAIPIGGPAFASSDAYIGPQPVFCNVAEIVGSKTFIVDFCIDTWVNECYLYETTPPSILSLTWRMTHESNPHNGWLTRRTIVGRATFNPVSLQSIFRGLGAVPDDFRSYFFHPIPSTFMREDLEVTATEDGRALEYTIVDQEKHYVIDWRGGGQDPSTLESTHTARLWRPTAEQVLPGWMSFGAGAIQGLLNEGEKKGGFWKAVSKGFWGLGGVLLDLFGGGNINPMQLVGNAISALNTKIPPLLSHTITCRVQGAKPDTRANLYSIAQAIVADRISFLPLIGSCAGLDSEVTYDNMNRAVQTVTRFSTGPFASSLGPAVFKAFDVEFPDMPAVDVMGGTVAGIPIITTGSGAQPAPVGDGVSRGSYLADCVANQLLRPCEKPAFPAEPRNSLNLREA